ATPSSPRGEPSAGDQSSVTPVPLEGIRSPSAELGGTRPSDSRARAGRVCGIGNRLPHADADLAEPRRAGPLQLRGLHRSDWRVTRAAPGRLGFSVARSAQERAPRAG